MNNLSLIGTEELLTEVFNRFDGIVVMGVQQKTKNIVDSYYRRYAGGQALCLGLAELLVEIIKDDYKKDEA